MIINIAMLLNIIDTNIIEYIVNQLVNQVNNYEDFEKIMI